MLKGLGNRGGRETIIIGLSFANLERLKKDEPIVIWREEMGVERDIIIFAGKTEEAMAKLVANPQTIVHDNKTVRPRRQ